MKEMNCPLCEEKMFSGIGHGCKMCGMVLKDSVELFCSERCEEKFGEINDRKNKNYERG